MKKIDNFLAYLCSLCAKFDIITLFLMNKESCIRSLLNLYSTKPFI